MAKFKGQALTLACWFDDFKTRDKGCYSCTKEGCQLNTTNALAANCYNIQVNFTAPSTPKDPYWTEHALRGNFWYEFFEDVNIGSWAKFVLYGFGTYHANTGTFGRHSWANQDPIFYAHHTFTFLLNEYGLDNIADHGLESPPLYGIDEILTERGVPECPGHNSGDTSIYRNLIRYKVGQEPGTHRTWEHILEMWSPQCRDFEWIINNGYITNYDSILRYDDSCEDGCVDEAFVILGGMPDTMSKTEICEYHIGMIQNSTSFPKEVVCQFRFKDLTYIGASFLSDSNRFDWACAKTCGYCKLTCG